MGQGDRGHPDFRDHWLARKRWSSNTTIPSGKKVVGIAAQHDFYSCGEDVEIKSDSNKTDEAPLSSANAVEWNGGGIEIAERLEAMAGLGRYERPVRRTIFQKEVLSAQPPVSSSWGNIPDNLESQAYFTADEGSDDGTPSLSPWQSSTSTRYPSPIPYSSSTSYPSSISHSSSQTFSLPPNPLGAKRSRDNRSRNNGSVASYSTQRSRGTLRGVNRGRDSVRSRIQVDKMQVIQTSIQDGSPYYFTREERFADPPPFLDETPVEPDPEPVIIQEDGLSTYNPDDFKALYGESPCVSYHLKGSCADLDCEVVHQAAKFSKVAKDQLRQYVRNSPCAYGIECKPTRVQDCLYLHICPLRDQCRNPTCGFRDEAFEGKGHEPNRASRIYAETLNDEYATLMTQRTAFMDKRDEARSRFT